jgi:hypothetical protein
VCHTILASVGAVRRRLSYKITSHG